MRVLYVSRGYTTHDRRFLAQIARRHEVHFLRCEREHHPYERRPLPSGVHVVPWDPSEGEIDPIEAVRAAPRLERVIRDVDPDVVHAGPVQGCGLMAILGGARSLVLMSWGSDLLVDAERDELWSWATRYALSHCDLLICDNRAVGARARELAELPADRIVMFPWGIDVAAFAPGPDRSGLRARPGWEEATIVISTRSLETRYGVDVVLEAFARAQAKMPQLRLLLIGDGVLAASIDQGIRERGLGVVVYRMGAVLNERLPDLFRASDVYVSASRSDGTSVSMLEAMATGLPVVVSDLPGNREWVREGENGWLARQDDPGAFAAALCGAARLGDPERRRIAEANRRLVELRADENVAFQPLFDAYERVGRTRMERIGR